MLKASKKKQDTYKNDNLIISIIGIFVRVGIAVVAAMFIYKAVLYCYDFGYRIFNEPAMNNGTGRLVTVSVEEDMSPKDLGMLMEEKGLSRDWKLFALQYLCSEYKDEVQPGVYQLNTNMTAEEMFAYMATFYQEEEEVETLKTEESEDTSPVFEVEELTEEEVADEE